jgi:hypothetical protein
MNQSSVAASLGAVATVEHEERETGPAATPNAPKLPSTTGHLRGMKEYDCRSSRERFQYHGCSSRNWSRSGPYIRFVGQGIVDSLPLKGKLSRRSEKMCAR